MKIIYNIVTSLALSFVATINVFASLDVAVIVKDSLTMEPVQYATVELLNANDSLISGGITNEDGYINLPTTAIGKNKIRIQFIGYKTYEALVTNNRETVLLKEDSEQLNEVVVNGQARIVKIDRDVFVITDQQRSGTATSRELLGKLNGLTYDPISKSVSVNGSSNILILMDGIEKDQNLAKTLPPDRIDKVEVIKSPMGKYAADGYAAVINIITNKNYSGVEVSAGLYSNSNFSKFYNGSSPFWGEGGNVNVIYTYKKLNLYGTYSGNWDNSSTSMEYNRRYGDLTVNTSPMDYKHPNVTPRSHNNNMSVGGDYSINTGNIIAFELSYNTGLSNSTTQYDLTTYKNDVLIDESQSTTNTRNTNDAIQGTLTYLGKLGAKSNLQADLRYRHYMPTNYSTFIQGVRNSTSYNSQTENFYRANIDYTYQFNSRLSLNVAYGMLIDNFNLHQTDTKLTYNQIRNRPSAYLTYNPLDKWSVKVGGMIEFYHQAFDGTELSQVGVLPFANIMYKPSGKFCIIAKYHATPVYPDINSMTTFKTQQDTLTWSVGNSGLRMSTNNKISLEIDFLKYFGIEPYYSFGRSYYQQYLWEEANQYFQTRVNNNEISYGTSAWFNIPLTKQLMWKGWMLLDYDRYRYEDTSNAHTTFQFSTSLYYTIPKLDMSASFEVAKYIFNGATLQGSHSGGNDWVNIVLQKDFFKRKISCSLNYMLPIKIGDIITYDRKDIVQTHNYYSETRGNLDLLRNAIFLNINFHFNSGKKANVRKTSLDYDNNTRGINKLGL